MRELANPHPSGHPDYDVEAVDVRDGMVRVRYVSQGLSWWITEAAWADWKRLGGHDEQETNR